MIVCDLCEVAARVLVHANMHRYYTYDDRICNLPALGTFDDSHPIMAGVTSFVRGSNHHRAKAPPLAPGAALVAQWSDGCPLVTRVLVPVVSLSWPRLATHCRLHQVALHQEKFKGLVVVINAQFGSGAHGVTGNGMRLLVNALSCSKW